MSNMRHDRPNYGGPNQTGPDRAGRDFDEPDYGEPADQFGQGPYSQPQPQQGLNAPPPGSEELTPDAIARHISPEPPRPLSERPRAAGVGAGPGGRMPRQKQPALRRRSSLRDLWDRKPIVVAGAGAGAMVVLSLLIVGIASLFASDSGPDAGDAMAGKPIEGRLVAEAEADLENISATPAEAAKPEVQDAAAPRLITSSMIEMQPAMAIPFPIFVANGAAAPSESALKVSGLPDGATLSAGRAIGDGEWTVETDQVGDLSITVPAGTEGSHDLKVALVDAQGGSITDAETTLVIKGSGGAVTANADEDAAASQDQAAATNPMPASSQDTQAPDGAVQTASVGEDAASAPTGQPQPSSLGQPSDDGVAGAADGKWMVVTTAVNMRAKPASDGETVIVQPKGKRLRVTEDQYGWLKVTDPEGGQSGWIYKRFLEDAE